MHVTLEPFKAEHALEIISGRKEVWLDLLIRCEMDGPAFTGRLEDGRILGCAGLMTPAPWIADAWLIPSSLVKEYPIAFHKVVMGRFQELLHKSNAHRIQAWVDPKYPERVRWIEHLGFMREATMHAFGPDREDVWLYALIRENGHGR